MSKKVIVTIGRQFGSGGRYVGRLLADKLGIPFYDKELLSEAAKNSGICEEIFEEHDEKPTRSLLFSLVTGMQQHAATGAFYMDMPLNHKIFLAQFDAIRRIAGEGSCVIVGRCADYVLRENPDAVSIFVKGDMESKTRPRSASARRTSSAPATTTTTPPPPGATWIITTWWSIPACWAWKARWS